MIPSATIEFINSHRRRERPVPVYHPHQVLMDDEGTPGDNDAIQYWDIDGNEHWVEVDPITHLIIR